MIDYSDMDWPLWGIGGILGLVLSLVLLFIACHNDSECSKRSCRPGLEPRLMDHDCLCVQKAE